MLKEQMTNIHGDVLQVFRIESLKITSDARIHVDDGEVEKGVKQENIARAPGDSELEVGQTIEAKYRGKKKYYPGKIAARSGDTYDIDYDDGEKESGVARNLIREA